MATSSTTRKALIAISCATGLAGCTSTTSRPAGPADLAPQRIMVCHGFDCYRRTRVDIGTADASRMAELIAAGSASAAAERRGLGQAIAYFETRATAAIGVADLPKSDLTQSGKIGQMDCIDESTNTRALLLWAEKSGLLQHHRVEENRSRGLFVDGRYPHSTAVVSEKATGSRFAIDSWYEPAGGTPDIMPLREWMGRGVLGER